MPLETMPGVAMLNAEKIYHRRTTKIKCHRHAAIADMPSRLATIFIISGANKIDAKPALSLRWRPG